MISESNLIVRLQCGQDSFVIAMPCPMHNIIHRLATRAVKVGKENR